MTGRKEVFEPLVSGSVRMYVCGVTVYDECHVGHARSALVFEVIRRYLEACAFTVTFVKNFTDIDDKIIARAHDQGLPWEAIASRYIGAYHRDMGRLGVRPASIEPKATEHMREIIDLVDRLVRKEMAYRLDGDIYYDVNKFSNYGALSKRKLDAMQAGARVDVNERKRHPMDFVLWKSAKPGEPSWSSPWGAGRPGWHIECSAMSMRHLGETFDIHGGGADLIFPHHENEIAQSTAATGKALARYWLHNGFVQVNQEKMSKSLGNFFTVREIFEKFGYRDEVTAEVLRYCLLATHYRSPLEFSDQALQEAKKALDGFYGLFQRLEEPGNAPYSNDANVTPKIARLERTFQNAMDDDFNTPSVIASFQRLRGDINKLFETRLAEAARKQALRAFQNHGNMVGLFQLSPKDWQFGMAGSIGHAERFEASIQNTSGLRHDEIEQLVTERTDARRLKHFARADEIRQYLALHGVTIEDRSDGTTRWKR